MEEEEEEEDDDDDDDDDDALFTNSEFLCGLGQDVGGKHRYVPQWNYAGVSSVLRDVIRMQVC
jgi:hypothetical protein